MLASKKGIWACSLAWEERLSLLTLSERHTIHSRQICNCFLTNLHGEEATRPVEHSSFLFTLLTRATFALLDLEHLSSTNTLCSLERGQWGWGMVHQRLKLDRVWGTQQGMIQG